MNLVDDRGDTLVTVFPANINSERLITIPIETRDYFKNEYDLELTVGTMVQVRIKNGTKESNHFPRQVTSGFRIRIPPEIVKFYQFKLGESIEVEIIIDKQQS